MIWQVLLILAGLAIVGATGFLAGTWWASHEEPDRWDMDHPNEM